MRGGLDEALSRLARRDELRRRAAGQAPGTPQAVTELVEAVAAVVARHPELAITMGVEGAGDPVLLQFALEDGVVQVTADNTVAGRIPEAAPTAPRHADFDIDLDVTENAATEAPVVASVDTDDPVGTGSSADPGYGSETRFHSETGPGTGSRYGTEPEYGTGPAYDPSPAYGTEPAFGTGSGTPTDGVHESERGHDPERAPDAVRPDRRESRSSAEQETYELAGYQLESPTRRLYSAEPAPSPLAATPPPPVPSPLAATPPPPVPSPLAATPPPPVPPQSAHRSRSAESPRSRSDGSSRPAPERRPELRPLPKPEPLRFEPEATEQAAKRLAAMLREDPSLLQQAPPD